MREALLSIRGVHTYYGNIAALKGVDVEVGEGGTLLEDGKVRMYICGPTVCLERGRVCLWPIVLQKSIFADDQNSAGRGRDFRVRNVRDLTASRKIRRRLR